MKMKNCKDDIYARQICQEIGTVIILCSFVIVLPYFVEQKRESMLSLDLENLQEWNFLFLMAIFLIQWLRFIVVIGAQVAKVVRVICFL